MKAYFNKRILRFKHPAGTSRGILHSKPSWFLFLYEEKDPLHRGIGEVSIIPGLSRDDEQLIEQKLWDICNSINSGSYNFNDPDSNFPAISFGIETALLDLESGGKRILFQSDFIKGNNGIRTNGLIWMGNQEFINKQIKNKLKKGFRCLKMKIGSTDISTELDILKQLRIQYSNADLELRVDANGSFSFKEAQKLLKPLRELGIHSIEQPILPNQLNQMAELCNDPPIPIALDEELLGNRTYKDKKELINFIKPQYLILKPSLLGGFKKTSEWINIADEYNIGWWVTSALESNIGLNAIAQWIGSLNTNMYQGLGLGNLYVQNITSPLNLHGERLFYNPLQKWNYDFIGQEK